MKLQVHLPLGMSAPWEVIPSVANLFLTFEYETIAQEFKASVTVQDGVGGKKLLVDAEPPALFLQDLADFFRRIDRDIQGLESPLSGLEPVDPEDDKETRGGRG